MKKFESGWFSFSMTRIVKNVDGFSNFLPDKFKQKKNKFFFMGMLR